MDYNQFEEYGRKLLIQFTCCRCGKKHVEDLAYADKRAGDHYGSLHNLPLPKGWSEYLLSTRQLCDTCTIAVEEFFQNKR